jgi:hypothetical protein
VANLMLVIGLIVVVLVATMASALGVAWVGRVLHRLFDLSQWQGTVIAFGIAAGFVSLVYKILSVPSSPFGPGIWDYELDEDDDFDEIVEEPLIVPWRRSRSGSGEKSGQKKVQALQRGKRRK